MKPDSPSEKKYRSHFGAHRKRNIVLLALLLAAIGGLVCVIVAPWESTVFTPPDPLAPTVMKSSQKQTQTGVSASDANFEIAVRLIEVDPGSIRADDTNNLLNRVIQSSPTHHEASAETRTLLDIARAIRATEFSCQSPGLILSDSEAQALVAVLQKQAGTSILSAPRMQVGDGQNAFVRLGSTTAIAVNIDTNAVLKSNGGNPAAFYATAPLDLGIRMTISPKLQSNDNLTVSVTNHIVFFKPFAAPASGDIVTLKTEAGDKVRLQRPVPQCDILSMRASATLASGQSLLIGGPTYSNTVIIRDKVPLLGDVPLIKKAFVHEHTNQIPQQVFLLLTPTRKSSETIPGDKISPP
jgi:type II secretory pathway component GspD/PulD (secretin)